MLAYPADFYKVVSTATTLSDNVTMIKFLAREGDRHSLVGMCMGEQGIISRVLGVRAGSVFTFASAGAGQETAPDRSPLKNCAASTGSSKSMWLRAFTGSLEIRSPTPYPQPS